MTTAFRPPVADLGGLVLNNRYELATLLRSDGPEQTYLGWDSSLFRAVQIRVLNTTDSVAVAQFRSAIKTAAELMFEHTLMIYDAGAQSTPDGRLWWAVAEYFESALPAKLSAADVLALAKQLADTMGQAHAAGITHGDLSPRSVLVSADLQLRIARFGDSSPAATMASDVLGFSAVLLHWLDRCPLPSPLRRRLNQLADRCGTGLTDFEAIISSLDVPLRRPPRTAPLPIITTPTAPAPAKTTPSTTTSGTTSGKKRLQQRNSAIAVPGFAIVILLGLTAAFWGLSTLNSEPTAALRVPDVRELSLADAKIKLSNAGFELGGQRSEPSMSIPSGQILSTDPASGQRADRGSFVVIVLSSGRPQTEVPEALGSTVQKFTAALVARGLRVKVTEKDGPAVAGTILSVSPAAGSRVEADSIVQISTASGYQTVPTGLVGKTAKEAVAALHAAGFTAQIAKAPRFGAKPGTVLAIAPANRAPAKGLVTMSVAAED